MSKHTPGPWLVATSNSWRRIVSLPMQSVCEPITQNDGHPDLYFRNGGSDGPDARLIAAAPELLEALKQILAAYCGVMRSEFDFPSRPWTPERDNDIDALQAIAAIRKATGEQQ